MHSTVLVQVLYTHNHRKSHCVPNNTHAWMVNSKPIHSSSVVKLGNYASHTSSVSFPRSIRLFPFQILQTLKNLLQPVLNQQGNSTHPYIRSTTYATSPIPTLLTLLTTIRGYCSLLSTHSTPPTVFAIILLRDLTFQAAGGVGKLPSGCCG
jgi:hypothetical protein